MNKIIKIYTGSNPKSDLYEGKLHPENQIIKVRSDLKKEQNEYIVYTNSPFVVEAFNSFGREKDYKIIMFFDEIEMNSKNIFDKFSKVFEKLIFK